MIKRTFFAFFLMTSMLACKQENNSNAANATQSTFLAEGVQKEDGFYVGEILDTKVAAITYDSLRQQLSSVDSITTMLSGVVVEVCQKKGCWMTIKSDQAGVDPLMVKFKDYAFFMPKDIAGKTVLMQGKAYKEETPVDELRHYAEDAGKSKAEIAAITQPKTELKFEATGVVIK